MKTFYKRVMSLVIALLMIFGTVSLIAFAQEDLPERSAVFSLVKTDETIDSVMVSLVLERGLFSSIEIEIYSEGLTCTGIEKGEMLARLFDKDWAECYFSANADAGRAAFICSASYNYAGEFLKLYFRKDSSDFSVDVVIPACASMQGSQAAEINVTQPETLKNDVLYSKLSDVRLKYKDSLTLKPQLVADSSAGEYTFSSSDPKTVSVDADGTIHALREGRAVIKVVYTEPDSVPIFDFCTVTVRMTLLQRIIYYLFFGWIWY